MKLLSTTIMVALLGLQTCGSAAASDTRYPDELKDTTGKYAGSYLCVPETATGLKYDPVNQQWVSAPFKPNKQFTVLVSDKGDVEQTFDSEVVWHKRYLIERQELGDSERKSCGLQAGDGRPAFDKTVPISSNVGFIECVEDSANSDTFRFNLRDLRYMRFAGHGFVEPWLGTKITPYLEVGLCSKLN